MADTIDLFLDGLEENALVQAIEACMHVAGERRDEGARISFTLPEFQVRLATHTFVATPDMDFPSFEYWLSAKNYEGPDALEESESVRWMRALFTCLRTRGDVRMLLSYNLDYPMEYFEPAR